MDVAREKKKKKDKKITERVEESTGKEEEVARDSKEELVSKETTEPSSGDIKTTAGQWYDITLFFVYEMHHYFCFVSSLHMDDHNQDQDKLCNNLH